MSDRATPAARDLYHGHIRECRDCRRMHRLLYALYEGPIVPVAPGGVDEERQFHAALRRSRDERPEPWYHKLSMRAGIAALAGSAAVLALALFDVGPAKDLDLSAAGELTAHNDATDDVQPASEHGEGGGISHEAQNYGRVVGGDARVSTPDGSATTDTFPVGTRFELDDSDSLQVGLVGKLVANFTPGSTIKWTAASPSLIEIEVERGIAAVRYDRRSSDPILQVRTPSAVVRVVGTVFTVQVEDDTTRVAVLRGLVEVLDPATSKQIAEVESGFRYDVREKAFADAGKVEVAAALPLSNDVADTSAHADDLLALADGRIPDSWNVRGLPADPALRRLEFVPESVDDVPTIEYNLGRTPPTTVDPYAGVEVPPTVPRKVRDEGEDLLEHLSRDVEATRRKEVKAGLETCRSLYNSPDTRYRAAKCLTEFIGRYGSDPAAVEGYLLVGQLRMDYALDYKAAEKAFETFLRRAPTHTYAERAHYLMWLSSVEDGRISVALQRARAYLERYPSGKYVGKVLQRFPELKSEL